MCGKSSASRNLRIDLANGCEGSSGCLDGKGGLSLFIWRKYEGAVVGIHDAVCHYVFRGVFLRDSNGGDTLRYVLMVMLFGDGVYVDTLPSLEVCEMRLSISQMYSRNVIKCLPARGW